MNARERFRGISRFERPNDPFVWGVPAWNEALDRWVREGMPVTNLDNTKQLTRLMLGPLNRIAGITPNGCITGMGRNGNPPWIVALDPMYEVEVLS